jgi:cbb3-type cytochrome oxidase subunit 3
MAAQTSTAAPAVDYDSIIDRKQQEIYSLGCKLHEARTEVENERRFTLLMVGLTALVCFLVWLFVSSVAFRYMAHGAHARHNAENQARIYLRQTRFPFAGVYCKAASFGNFAHCRATSESGATVELSCDDDELGGNDGCTPGAPRN